jgi:predicted amidohydrolase
MKKRMPFNFILSLFLICFNFSMYSQEQSERIKTKVAVIQSSDSPRQDPFMADYDPTKVEPQSMAHFNKLLKLFEKAGNMGADIVCGPEDMQNIGAYGLHVDVMDPVTGDILFISLATSVPGPLTDQVSEIARKHGMYIIAPIYERDKDKVFNTSVIFDREGNIIGKHRKTVLPVMETWLVSTGDKLPVFRTDFGTVAIATCWEIVFPEISTIYALKGADIIFNPTMGRENQGPSLKSAPRYRARAMDNFVYIAPSILGSDGSGIIDFYGEVVAEAPGVSDTVIMAEIDFKEQPVLESDWWTTINGTDNIKAIHYLSRRPGMNSFLNEPDPPVLNQYRKIQLTTGVREMQLKAVREVDYGQEK